MDTLALGASFEKKPPRVGAAMRTIEGLVVVLRPTLLACPRQKSMAC